METKIAFICAPGFEKPIRNTVNLLSGEYDTRLFIVSKKDEIENACRWGDLIWFDFANEIAIAGTNLPFINSKKVIVRLRSYEFFERIYQKITWDNVDLLVFTSEHMRKLVTEFSPEIFHGLKSSIMSNGFDVDSCPDYQNISGFNIAWVPTMIDHRKNPPMVLQIMKRLTDIDNRFRLFVAGRFRDLRHDIYMKYAADEMGISQYITYHGYVDDMELFWKDKQFLLSTSLFESFGNNVFEAMARNICPVVHNFLGSKELYPIEAIFNTVDGAVFKFLKPKERNWREFVRNYTIENQMKKTKEIIESIVNVSAIEVLK